ncbi:MAG: AtpZ/AtpI family protein [Firmicutes bacterium]|nr:AtpZ/AtpI family protein [Bacillota bacterium]
MIVKKGVNVDIKNKDQRTNKNGNKKTKNGSPLQALAITTTIGMELAITSVMGFYGGSYIDKKLGTTPVFLIIGLLAGLAIGVVGIIKTLNTFFKDKTDKGVK